MSNENNGNLLDELGKVLNSFNSVLLLNRDGSFKIEKKNEQEIPSHEEIMKPNRYWRGADEEGYMVWEKADLYREDDKKYLIHDDWKDRLHFSGRRFCDGIPPEAV